MDLVYQFSLLVTLQDTGINPSVILLFQLHLIHFWFIRQVFDAQLQLCFFVKIVCSRQIILYLPLCKNIQSQHNLAYVYRGFAIVKNKCLSCKAIAMMNIFCIQAPHSFCTPAVMSQETYGFVPNSMSSIRIDPVHSGCQRWIDWSSLAASEYLRISNLFVPVGLFLQLTWFFIFRHLADAQGTPPSLFFLFPSLSSCTSVWMSVYSRGFPTLISTWCLLTTRFTSDGAPRSAVQYSPPR